jgi:glutaconate CoA-transferase subunit B
VHPGVSVDRVRAATGWDLRISPTLTATPPPTERELTALRELHSRTSAAHANGRSVSA